MVFYIANIRRMIGGVVENTLNELVIDLLEESASRFRASVDSAVSAKISLSLSGKRKNIYLR